MIGMREIVVARVRVVAPLLFLAVLVMGACSDSTESEDPTISSVVVSPSDPTLESIGATASLSAQAREADGSTISGVGFDWTSSNGSVATVDANGQVTALGNGTTTVRATVQGGTVSGQVTVTVEQVAASVEVAPAAGDILVGETIQLTASAEDAGGTAIDDPDIAWSSDDDQIAEVDGSGLVTGTGGGTATITASSGSGSAEAEITVTLPDVVVSEDMDMEGTWEVGDLTIDAGVTLTATGDLTIRAAGTVEVDGDVMGDCVVIDLESEADVTVNGMVHNGCTSDPGDPDNPPMLRLVSTGAMTLDGADLESSGDIEIMNDPSLTDDDFPLAGGPATSPPARQQSFNIVEIKNTGSRFVAPPAQDGDPGQNGGNGKDGREFTLRATGLGVTFGGNVLIEGQSGGDGGDGTHSSNDHATATGGDGGEGGKIKIFVDGPLDFQGSSNIVRSGGGGDGGNAVATGEPNAEPPRAPGAEATGGNGGAPGLIDIRGGQGITGAARLTVEVGLAGKGGDATATGADGADATAEKEAQAGGEAEARGGQGAHTPDRDFDSWGDVSGGDPIVRSVGGGSIDGGAGGKATATGGKGGNGLKPNKDGAVGGDITAFAGDGGNARLRGLANELLGDGGAGALATLMMGNGGDGWDDCEETVEAGGNGGIGGEADGEDGEGGTGAADGADGGVMLENLSNGGDGGNGEAPGAGGAKGNDSVQNNGARTEVDPVFQDGEPGMNCAQPEEVKTRLMATDAQATSGTLAPGTYPVGLRSNDGEGDPVAEMDVKAEGSGNRVDASNNWLGAVGPSFIELVLGSITPVEGVEIVEKKEVEVCVPSSFVATVGGPNAISNAEPLEVFFLNAARVIIASYQLTQIGQCLAMVLPPEAVYAHLVGPNGIVVMMIISILMTVVIAG